MTETANAVTICSNALLSLGAQPISSFDEAGGAAQLDRAKLAAGLYPQARAALPDAQAPEFGYAHRFLLPGDWLRTLAVGNPERNERIDFRAEGRYLLSDAVVFPLTYIADVDEHQWDSLLVDAMTATMAVRMAYPITKSAAMIETKTAELRAVMQQARSVDGQDEPPETLGDFPLMLARLGGASGWGGRGEIRFHQDQLYWRRDEPAPNGAKLLENVFVLVQGGVIGRYGLRFTQPAKHGDKHAVLIPYVFNRDQAYMLEVGDAYLRVYLQNGAQVQREVSPGVFAPFEIQTDYAEADLDSIDYVQSADTMFFSTTSIRSAACADSVTPRGCWRTFRG
ncbi:hypothetical protein SNK04_014160 [Fusarium graminearum]